jgi:hypothetical protein
MSEAQREMPRYQCHKQVWALKIAAISHLPNPDTTAQSAAASYGATITPADGSYAPFDVSPEFVTRHNPVEGGYYVVYDDGYKSFSPAAAFDAGYSPVLTDYRDCVRAEARELGENARKLAEFLASPASRVVSNDALQLMALQHGQQCALLETLNARIALF